MTEQDQSSTEASIRDRVHQQLSTLDDIQHRPLAEHAEIYAGVHTRLQAALTEIDGGAS